MSDPALTEAAIEGSAPPRLRDALRASLRGDRYDYTAGPVGRAVLLLAVPMVLEMAMESVFAVCDIFFVGRLGASAVATVGLTESLLSIVYTLAMGVAIAATAIVARRIGERDEIGAGKAAGQSLLLGVVVAVVLGVIGVTFAPRLLAMMGAGGDILAVGSTYSRIMIGGSATIIFLFLINAIFRGAGDAAIAMRVLWLANAINIALGPCLIFGLGPFPKMGVTGAATATTIGRGVGALFALSRLVLGKGRIQAHLRDLTPDRELLMRLLRLAASGTGQIIIGTASWIALVRITSLFGSDALAGYTIGIRILLFALLPSFGMSNAAATMVGQALGAGDPARAKQAAWTAGKYNLAALGVVAIVFVVLAHPLAWLFSSDPVVIRHAASCLRIVALGFPLYAFGMVFTQSFNGAGDTTTPTWLNFIVFWLWEIPLAWLLATVFHMGPEGVFVSIAVAFSTLAIASGVLFQRGGWATRRV